MVDNEKIGFHLGYVSVEHTHITQREPVPSVPNANIIYYFAHNMLKTTSNVLPISWIHRRD
jgi:hypothetical protein